MSVVTKSRTPVERSGEVRSSELSSGLSARPHASVARLGFWSAVVTAISSAGWFIALQVQEARAPMGDWHGAEAYGASYDPIQLLDFYPSMVLSVAFLVLMACVHQCATTEAKAWSLSALAIAVVYATMASTNYNIQLTAVRQGILAGEAAMLAPFILVNPHSVARALGNAYVYMCLAMCFAAPLFREGGLDRWIRWLFLAQGLVALVQIGWSIFDLSMTVFVAVSMVWVVGAPVAAVLLAVRFWRLGHVPPRAAVGETE